MFEMLRWLKYLFKESNCGFQTSHNIQHCVVVHWMKLTLQQLQCSVVISEVMLQNNTFYWVCWKTSTRTLQPQSQAPPSFLLLAVQKSRSLGMRLRTSSQISFNEIVVTCKLIQIMYFISIFPKDYLQGWRKKLSNLIEILVKTILSNMDKPQLSCHSYTKYISKAKHTWVGELHM